MSEEEEEEEKDLGGGGGPPAWKMELKSSAAGDLGVAPSQIMDTGQDRRAITCLEAHCGFCLTRCCRECIYWWVWPTGWPRLLPEMQLSLS